MSPCNTYHRVFSWNHFRRSSSGSAIISLRMHLESKGPRFRCQDCFVFLMSVSSIFSWGMRSDCCEWQFFSRFFPSKFLRFALNELIFRKSVSTAYEEILSETIDSHGESNDGFAPAQPASRGPALTHDFFFFKRFDGSVIASDGIMNLRTARLAIIRLILHHFELTKVPNRNRHPTGIS